MNTYSKISLITLLVFGPLLSLSACEGSGVTDEGVGADSSSPLVSQETAPTAEPTATREPTKMPTDEPSRTPLPEPTVTPLPQPTETPLAEPTATVETGSRDDAGETVAVAPGSFACMGTSDRGLTCLTENGEWQNFTRDTSHLGGDFISDIDACPNGALLIVHGSGVSIFDGRDWREIPIGWGFGSPEAIACAGEDAFWVAHFDGVSHFDGSQWQNFGAAELSFGEEATNLVKDIADDEDGNTWVVTANSIARYDGQQWRVFQFGQGIPEKYFYDAIAIDENNRPWVAHSDGLLAFGDDEWDLNQNRNIYTLQDIAVDQDGKKWVATYSQGLAVFDGAAWQIRDRFSGDLQSNQINKIKVDEIGRVWAATEWGLHVFDGQSWHIYRMDNSELLENSIRTLDIVGNPPLPDPQEKVAGSLSGSIVGADGPYATANVEICVESLGSFFEGETPCTSQPFVRSEVTDDAGNFSFGDLPAGYYVIAVETEDGWAQLTAEYGIGSERVLVVPGENSDIGELTLNTEE